MPLKHSSTPNWRSCSLRQMFGTYPNSMAHLVLGALSKVVNGAQVIIQNVQQGPLYTRLMGPPHSHLNILAMYWGGPEAEEVTEPMSAMCGATHSFRISYRERPGCLVQDYTPVPLTLPDRGFLKFQKPASHCEKLPPVQSRASKVAWETEQQAAPLMLKQGSAGSGTLRVWVAAATTCE